MRKTLLLIALVCPVSLWGVNQAVNGSCTAGGKPVVTSGINSTTLVQASYPGCTVTVYLTGTTTPATIFSNSGGTSLGNPFTANIIDGSWLFFAAVGTTVDIQMSGGTPAFPIPVTLPAVTVGGSGGGGPGAVSSVTGGGTVTCNPTTGSVVCSGIPGFLLADNFTGADICAKANAAEAALPAQGGVIAFSASSYTPCSFPIAITKNNVTLQGAGMGQVQGLSNGATILHFAAGVPGITVIGAGYVRITDLTLISASTVAGSDNGIYITTGDAPVVENVSLQGFGGIGVWMSETTDFWYLHRVWVDHIKGNGFEWSGVSHAGCSDINLGKAQMLSATNIGGTYAYNSACGVNNAFNDLHASGNAHGDYSVGSNYGFWTNIYSEAGGTLTTQPGSIWNQFNLTLFGLPTIIDNGVTFATEWHIAANAGVAGILPGQNILNIITMPGATYPQYFQWTVDNSYGLSLIDYKNATGSILTYNPGMYTADSQGWTFTQPVRIISPMRLDGYIDFSGQTPPNPPVGNCRVYNDSATGNLIGKKSDGSSCFSGGTTVNVNSSSVSNPNFNGTTPAAPGGNTNVTFQVSGSSVSAYIPSSSSPVAGSSGDLQKNSGSGTFAAAAINDNGTTLTASEPICVGASCPVSCGSATACNAYTEAATAGTPTAGESYCRADTTHNVLCSINGGFERAIPLIPASGAVNQAVCLLSSNPPILGKCTSVVSSGGTCTCVSF